MLTRIERLLNDQSDQDLHCSPFLLYRLLYLKIPNVTFKDHYCFFKYRNFLLRFSVQIEGDSRVTLYDNVAQARETVCVNSVTTELANHLCRLAGRG